MNEHASRALVRSAGEVGSPREDVRSGGLSLDPAAAEQVCSMLAQVGDRVDAWLDQAGNLAQPAPLGQNPVGAAMAAKFSSFVDNEDASFVGVLRRYREVLTELRGAVNDAVRRYGVVDEASAESLRKLAR